MPDVTSPSSPTPRTSGCRNGSDPTDSTTPLSGAADPCPAQSKTCAKCGASFNCGGEHCWCAEFTVSPATLQSLRGAFAGCLCPTCLAELACKEV